MATGVAKASGGGLTEVGIADLTASGTPDGTTYLRGDNTWQTPAGGSATQDAHYYRQVGTSPFEIWYPVSATTGNGLGTRALSTANTIYAMQHICTRTATIDRIAISTSVASANNAQNCRLGIYQATSATNIYPNALVLDAGTVNLSTAAGALAITVNQQLTANTLYWFVLTTSTTDATIRTVSPTHMALLLGYTSALGVTGGHQISVASAFGALPGTYPAGATIDASGSNAFGIFVRYSA